MKARDSFIVINNDILELSPAAFEWPLFANAKNEQWNSSKRTLSSNHDLAVTDKRANYNK